MWSLAWAVVALYVVYGDTKLKTVAKNSTIINNMCYNFLCGF